MGVVLRSDAARPPKKNPAAPYALREISRQRQLLRLRGSFPRLAGRKKFFRKSADCQENAMKEGLGPGGTTGDVHIDGNHLIHAAARSIALAEDPAANAARSDRH